MCMCVHLCACGYVNSSADPLRREARGVRILLEVMAVNLTWGLGINLRSSRRTAELLSHLSSLEFCLKRGKGVLVLKL